MTSTILHEKSNGAIIDVDIIYVDWNQKILKFDYLSNHDISEATACSKTVNLALYKVKIKLFKVELKLLYFTRRLILNHNYQCKYLKKWDLELKNYEEILQTFCSALVLL